MLLLLACHDATVLPERVSVEADAVMPSLVHVHWETSEAVVGEVTYALEGEPTVSTGLAPNATTSHEVEVWGIPAGSHADLQILDHADGVVVGETTSSVDMDPAPTDLARVEPVIHPDAPPTPWLLIASVNPSTGAASLQVVDWAGRPLWWLPPSNTLSGYARIQADGKGILYVTTDRVNDADQPGAIAHTGWDGTTTLWPAAHAHHDLLELPDGRVGATAWTVRDVDGELIGGDQVQIVGEAGVEEVVWDAFDHIPVVENRCWDIFELTDGAVDWTHVNGLDYDPGHDTWLVSLYCQESVIAVDGHTGGIFWGLGGEVGSLRIEGDPGFGPQHSPRFEPGGLRLYDNGMDIGAGSRVVHYAVDPGAGTATFAGDWHAPDHGYTGVMGETNAYADGSLVGMGFDGGVYYLGPDGTILGQLDVVGGETVGSVLGVAAMPLEE
jgi:hypothetical protein